MADKCFEYDQDSYILGDISSLLSDSPPNSVETAPLHSSYESTSAVNLLNEFSALNVKSDLSRETILKEKHNMYSSNSNSKEQSENAFSLFHYELGIKNVGRAIVTSSSHAFTSAHGFPFDHVSDCDLNNKENFDCTEDGSSYNTLPVFQFHQVTMPLSGRLLSILLEEGCVRCSRLCDSGDKFMELICTQSGCSHVAHTNCISECHLLTWQHEAPIPLTLSTMPEITAVSASKDFIHLYLKFYHIASCKVLFVLRGYIDPEEVGSNAGVASLSILPNSQYQQSRLLVSRLRVEVIVDATQSEGSKW